MKDYTLIANNKNKTKITFAYDNGLPYKDRVRPSLEYGTWEEDNATLLIKVNFNDLEMNFFENKNKIMGLKSYDLTDEYWIDLTDVYLIIRKNQFLEKMFKDNNIIIAFFHNDKFINALKY